MEYNSGGSRVWKGGFHAHVATTPPFDEHAMKVAAAVLTTYGNSS